MPRTAEHEIEQQEQGPVVARETELGDLTVSVVTFREQLDMGPVPAGLPGGSCACPHWGVLRAGRAEVRYDDGRAETVEPGDLYVMTPGHVPVFAAGTELVMFSPTAELTATDRAIQEYVAAQYGDQEAAATP
ncbi:MAG: cupin domain-containing protein [Actinomycetota bacterium]|nr:cupin domain-containing protein [Actinomycetota bacterium]